MLILQICQKWLEKNNSKAKEKKLDRKLMEMRLNAGCQSVKSANAQENPLAALPSFSKVTKNGLDLTLETTKAPALDKEAKDKIFELLENNMKAMYIASDWGWNETNKKTELFEDTAWYLIARQQDGAMVAYAHFRYDMDFDDDVLYVYEIQLASTVQKKGLGKFMLKVLELLSIKADMTKIMATVFKHNNAARAFFKDGLKYEMDNTSPVDTVHEQFDYEILSRVNARKKKIEAIENGHA